MKIAFFSPENWFLELGHELKKHCDVLINQYSADCDAVLGMSESQINKIPQVKNLYLYQWDCYDWRGNPKEWVELMRNAKEVWTPSMETTELTRKRYNIDSVVVRFFVQRIDGFERFVVSRGDYIVQGARNSEDVRWEWLRKACQELYLPLEECYPNKYTREEYLAKLCGSRAVVSSRDEASTGGLCLFEAAQFGKPLLAGNCKSTQEYFGGEIIYFKKDDFEDFKEKLKIVYDMPLQNYKLAISYTVDKMALAVLQRLRETL